MAAGLSGTAFTLPAGALAQAGLCSDERRTRYQHKPSPASCFFVLGPLFLRFFHNPKRRNSPLDHPISNRHSIRVEIAVTP